MPENNNLLKVKVPSRYLGNEVNTIHKKWYKNKLRVALAFPDLYEIGVSHFGIQILYTILNDRSNTLAERVFAPLDDMEYLIRSGELEFCSLESKTPLRCFDIIGFSLLYELNYTNVLNMLSLSKIPLLAKQRENNYPIIVAGGPCTFNPEPVADIFDALVIGDGEEVIVEMAEIWEYWSKNKEKNKFELLREWAKIKGIYVPSFFYPSYNTSGNFQTLSPKYEDYKYVEKVVLEDLEKVPAPEKPIIPYGKAIHDKLRVELSRGCTRGCRFCQAGIIYRPVRERSAKKIFETVIRSMKTTGHEDVSLLSLSTGDYSCVEYLIKELIKYGVDKNLSVSLPSMRAKTLTVEIMDLLRKVKRTGFTIAPEAGSQRLRNVINKDISEEDILDTVEAAFSLGWKTIKLYFMIGLPTECHSDLQAIVDLVAKLNKIRIKFSKISKINVSISTFIPKSHTPFQWVNQVSLKDSKIKIEWLKKKLQMKGVRFKWQDPHVSFIEGILARGDRRLSELLVNAHKMGCKFDGWSDYFKFANWEKALKKSVSCKLSHNFNDLDHSLPWNHIHTGVNTNFLLEEYKKSSLEDKTQDCRYSGCQLCGVCNFKSINPVLQLETNLKEAVKNSYRGQRKSKIYKKIIIIFSKTGDAKYFGHLEMAKIFHRSFRRASVPLKYSEGFNPSPKVSFYDALPLGMESIAEVMKVVVDHNFETYALKKKLNNNLPRGLRVLKCYLATDKIISSNLGERHYIIKLKKDRFKQTKLNEFLNTKSFKSDFKQMVKKIKITNDQTLRLSVNTNKGSSLRPIPILSHIFDFSEDELNSAKIVKIR